MGARANLIDLVMFCPVDHFSDRPARGNMQRATSSRVGELDGTEHNLLTVSTYLSTVGLESLLPSISFRVQAVVR